MSFRLHCRYVRRFVAMKRHEVIFSKAICWILVGGFSIGCLWFGWGMHSLLSANTILMCGNSVTIPLGAMLDLGTPVGIAGVLGLAFLAHRGLASRWSILSSSVLVLAGTAGLLAFGFRFFHDYLPACRLSEIVWWLKPFGV